MYRLILLLLTLIFSVIAVAQDGNYTLGAKSAGLSGSSVTLTDNWSLFNNAGALASVEEASAFVSYQDRYQISGFQVIGGGFIFHHPQVNAGVKYYKFGDDLFSQQTVGLVLANRFQMVGLGAGINVMQVAAEGLQTRRAVAFEFGGVAEITDKLTFGAHIFNVKHRELYPATIKAGISIAPIQPLRFNIEVEKQLGVREKVKTGLQYQIIEKLYLRTGLSIQGNPLHQTIRSSFGLGFVPRTIMIDYALINAGHLGVIHEVSIAYQMKKS